MDFGFTPEENTFREQVYGFLRKEVTEDILQEQKWGVSEEPSPATWALIRQIGAKHWLCPGLPEEYGGMSASHTQRYIILEAMDYFGLPRMIGAHIVAPSLMLFGNEEQKKEYVPSIAKGELEFALGYSEANAGSDLTAVVCRATEDGDDYVINGEKMWTSGGQHSFYCWLLAKTDPQAPRHKGMSLFIVELNSPGITIRPMFTDAGLQTNEVCYDNVRVPKRNLVGEKDRGFYHLIQALAFERTHPIGAHNCLFDELLQYAKETKLNQNPLIRHRLASIAVELEAGRMLTYQVAWLQGIGQVPVAEPAETKVFLSELAYRITDLGRQMMGLHAQLAEAPEWAPLVQKINLMSTDAYRRNITAGTSEIQRNTIATQGLGLPRSY